MFMIDSLDLVMIEKIIEDYPIDGITCNLTILKNSSINDLKQLKPLIDKLDDQITFHIQVLT